MASNGQFRNCTCCYSLFKAKLLKCLYSVAKPHGMQTYKAMHYSQMFESHLKVLPALLICSDSVVRLMVRLYIGQR